MKQDCGTGFGLRLIVELMMFWMLILLGAPQQLSAGDSESGFLRRVHQRDDGTESKYAVFVPRIPPMPNGDGYPALLFLNGFGENGDDGLSITNNFGRPVWEMQNAFPFIGIAPQCRRGSFWAQNEYDSATAISILDEVIQDFNVDVNRVYLTGVSSGGQGVISMVLNYPKRFAALLPLSAPLGPDPDELTDALAKHAVPIWLAINAGDETPNLLEYNHAIRKALFQQGCEYRFTEYTAAKFKTREANHDTWNYMYRDPSVYSWLFNQSKDLNRKRVPCRPHELELEPNGAPSLIELDETSSRVDFEAILEVPLQLNFRDRDSALVGKPPILLTSISASDSTSLPHSKANDLLGRIAIRPQGWNHVGLVRSDERLVITVNGWRLFDDVDPLRGAPGYLELAGQRHFDVAGFGFTGILARRF